MTDAADSPHILDRVRAHVRRAHHWLRGRRGYRLGVDLGAAALVVWVGANTYPYAEDAPLWTVGDLPELPDAALNGWALIHGGVPNSAATPERLALLDDLEADSGGFWAGVEAEAGALRAWIDTHEHTLSRFEQARARPVFVDDCRPGEAQCATYDWYKVHGLAVGQAAELGLRGELDEAYALVDDLLRMDAAQLESATNLLGVLVGLANSQRALALAERLTALESGAAPSPARAKLVRRVRAFDARSFELTTLVEVRYVAWQAALDERARSSGDPLHRDYWLYNPGLTRRELDRRFARQHARAVVGDFMGSCGAGQARAQDQPFAALRNAVGDALVDSTDISELCAKVEDRLARLEELRARALSKL